MEKLKSCPFCGGGAVLENNCNYSNYYYEIYCNSEKCPMEDVWLIADTEEEAVRIWNTRCNDE